MVESVLEENLFSFLNETLKEVIYDKGNKDEIDRLFLIGSKNDLAKLNEFHKMLPKIKKQLSEDLEFFLESDPAISCKKEVVLAYPGYKAIAYYRVAHALSELGFSLNARLISEKAHTLTGIDIHPAASISSPFFIDHGTGIVVGETTIIGKNVKIYQGVTLGAFSLSKGKSMRGVKRHPTIGNNVTMYAGASLLGDIKIGNNVVIGSNVFLTENVPDNTKVLMEKPKLIMITKESK